MSSKTSSRTLFVHIGFHKTATTSIQQFLADNEKRLRHSGINYARIGRAGTSHSTLANALKSGQSETLDTQSLWKDLINEITASNCPSTLISSECFLEQKSIPANLARTLGGSLNVRVICYLRPQLHWLESVYNEVVKDDYRRYTGPLQSLREIEQGWIDYHEILQLWADTFGTENVIARPFQKSRMLKGDIYCDFLHALGLHLLPDFRIPPRMNVSLHASYIEFLRRVNTIPMLNETHRKVVIALEELSRSERFENLKLSTRISRLSPAGRAGINRRASVCNKELAIMFPGQTDKSNTQNFFDCEGVSEPDYLSAEQLLPVELEHQIFNALPSSIRTELEAKTKAIKFRVSGRSFLPVPATETTARLSAVIMRQRIEARMLYSNLANVQTGFRSRLRRWFFRVLGPDNY